MKKMDQPCHLKFIIKNTKKNLKKKHETIQNLNETEKIEKTALTLESELSFYLLPTHLYICSVCVHILSKSINN